MSKGKVEGGRGQSRAVEVYEGSSSPRGSFLVLNFAPFPKVVRVVGHWLGLLAFHFANYPNDPAQRQSKESTKTCIE